MQPNQEPKWSTDELADAIMALVQQLQSTGYQLKRLREELTYLNETSAKDTTFQKP